MCTIQIDQRLSCIFFLNHFFSGYNRTSDCCTAGPRNKIVQNVTFGQEKNGENVNGHLDVHCRQDPRINM